jgi:hypothetical protein
VTTTFGGHTVHQWKEAMLEFAHRRRLRVPRGFDVNEQHIGEPAGKLLTEIQHLVGLPETGELDEATRATLKPIFEPVQATPQDPRHAFVGQLWWAAGHTDSIHYPNGDIRPDAPVEEYERWKRHDLSGRGMIIDCSESIQAACFAAGLPSQCGDSFHTGLQFTGTLLSTLKQIRMQAATVGDLIVIGGGSGHHVVAILRPDNEEPLIWSQGCEAGPLILPLSEEMIYHTTGGSPDPIRVLQLKTAG